MLHAYIHRKELVFTPSVSLVEMWLCVCNCIYPEAALAFLASSLVAGVGSQGVKDWFIFICKFIYNIMWEGS
jgi:hypothetical protein